VALSYLKEDPFERLSRPRQTPPPPSSPPSEEASFDAAELRRSVSNEKSFGTFLERQKDLLTMREEHRAAPHKSDEETYQPAIDAWGGGGGRMLTGLGGRSD
jgi:hypothetical protein